MDVGTLTRVAVGGAWIIALVANLEALRMVEQPSGPLRSAGLTFGSIGLVLVVLLPPMPFIAFMTPTVDTMTVLLGGTFYGAILCSLGSIATIVLADVVDLAGRRRGRQP